MKSARPLLAPPTLVIAKVLWVRRHRHEPVWPSGKSLDWQAEGNRFESASAHLCLQKLWSADTVLWLCPSKLWNIKMALIAAQPNAEVILVVTLAGTCLNRLWRWAGWPVWFRGPSWVPILSLALFRKSCLSYIFILLDVIVINQSEWSLYGANAYTRSKCLT